MTDHPPTYPAPPPSRHPSDPPTDPTGDEVADGRVELELADLDLTGLVRWLCVRVHGLERLVARAVTNTESVRQAYGELGKEVGQIRSVVARLPCHGGGNGGVPRECPEHAAE